MTTLSDLVHGWYDLVRASGIEAYSAELEAAIAELPADKQAPFTALKNALNTVPRDKFGSPYPAAVHNEYGAAVGALGTE